MCIIFDKLYNGKTSYTSAIDGVWLVIRRSRVRLPYGLLRCGHISWCLIPPSDRTATIRDCTATVRRSENVQGRRQTWTQREKKSQQITNLNKAEFLLRSYCDLCDHTTFSRRVHHDISAHMAFLVRSMGSATAITGDPAALSPVHIQNDPPQIATEFIPPPRVSDITPK